MQLPGSGWGEVVETEPRGVVGFEGSSVPHSPLLIAARSPVSTGSLSSAMTPLRGEELGGNARTPSPHRTRLLRELSWICAAPGVAQRCPARWGLPVPRRRRPSPALSARALTPSRARVAAGGALNEEGGWGHLDNPIRPIPAADQRAIIPPDRSTSAPVRPRMHSTARAESATSSSVTIRPNAARETN